ncbi:hypothetical protein [Fontivita pretiosa]|uniref:hypothetical protein n=1 Tax=Fontivita pretiosa TaxID=2989684 RepID=UPI003D177EB1
MDDSLRTKVCEEPTATRCGRTGAGSRCRTPLRFALIAPVYFLAVTALRFGDLLTSARSVISSAGMDLDVMFYPLRRFVAQQLRDGHLPVWNPFSFGGVPALGNLQYAVLYPPNWLLAAPLSPNRAMNLIIAMHVMMSGLVAAMWCRRRGAGSIAALMGGTLFMFCGPMSMHIYAGHLPHLCCAAWMPLVLLCIDGVLDRLGGGWRGILPWCLLGAVAVAMQILAGHPQIAYITAIGVLVYSAIPAGRYLASRRRSEAAKLAAALAAMYALGAAISAAQLLPAIDVARELTRAGGTDFDFASSYSLPPENLLSLFLPHLFGNDFDSPYLGRWLMWETSLFVGATATILTVIGLARTLGSARQPVRGERFWRDLSLVALLLAGLILALGKYTPLYRLLLAVVPGLDYFRVPARFGLLTTLATTTLAASAFDQLLQHHAHLRPWRLGRWACLAAALAATMLAAALITGHSANTGSQGAWAGVIRRLADTGETWPFTRQPPDPQTIQRSADFAVSQLRSASLALAQIALVMAVAIRHRGWLLLLPALAVAQVWSGTDRAWQERFVPRDKPPPHWQAALSRLAPDQRALIGEYVWLNFPAQAGILSAGGYDTSVPRRWGNLLGWLIGGEKDRLEGVFVTRHIRRSRLWAMLRVRQTLPHSQQPLSDANPMPQFNLIRNVRVVGGPTESLQAVLDPDFDPLTTVILEQPPDPHPPGDVPAGESIAARASPDRLHVVGQDPSRIELTVELSGAAILLITDAYSSGWRVRATREGVPPPQPAYHLLPANHALRAVPLSAGKHHLLIEYRPISIALGLTLSGGAILLLGAAALIAAAPRLIRR